MSAVNRQWKEAVRLIATGNVTSGGAGVPTGTGMEIDVVTRTNDTRVRLIGQSGEHDNGIWLVGDREPS